MGLLLYILAICLIIPMTFINLIAVLYKYKIKWSTFNNYFKETAIDIDKFSNRNFRTLLNMTLKTKEGYFFGDNRETLSSVLGKNQRDNTLTKTGKILCSILDFIDKEHCKNSIKEL